MKATRITLIVLAALLVAAGISTTSYAFHSGGVAECGGCHSMHSPATGGSFLLVGTDQSSACLTCHEKAGDTGPSNYHVSTAPADMPAGVAPLQRTPGGDFGWLKKTYTFTVRGTAITEDGATHGHNIIAADKGYVVDPVNGTAPGGSFPSTQLACNSCHDPHGKYRRLENGSIAMTGAPIIGSGSYNSSAVPGAGQAVGVYRLLAGAGYTKDGITFAGVPAAKAPSSYNRTEVATPTRVAYGVSSTGGHVEWGTWCGTCHGDMHSTGGGSHYVHPTDEALGSTIATIYGQYLKSGDMTGVPASSFTSLVPFIQNTADYTELATNAVNDGSHLGGPSSTDKVSCMSCHRAHASGFEYMLRWEQEYEFITKNSTYGGTDTTPTDGSLHRGRTNAEKVASYYGRPADTTFASYQRVLCNKCHAKD